jgi:trk system potassium uptake protein TrkH
LSYAVRLPVLLKYFGQFCLVIGVLILVPLGASLIYGETDFSGRYGIVILAIGGLGFLLSRIRTADRIQDNEAMVLAAWLFFFTPLLMSYPLMAAGLGFLDAFFEAVSGVTTTGLSTLPSVENKPWTFLFARAWMQWYGGLGIVVLSLALVVRPGLAAKGLSVSETPEDDLVGGTKAHARRALTVYSVLTGASILSLLLLGLHPFNAIVYSLAAVSTGGFSPHDNSLAALANWPVQGVVILFCLAGAVPLTFYHSHRRRAGFDSHVLQLVGLLLCGLCGTVLLSLCMSLGGSRPWSEVFRHAPLMAFSAQTTAGFSTLEVSSLGAASKLTLIFSMISGGGIGSTAGGFKILRLMILIQVLRVAIARFSLARHAVLEPRLAGQRLPDAEIHNALLIILLFFGGIGISWLPFVWAGYDPLDALFEVVSATGTVGLSAGLTQAGLPAFLKGILCADMLMGRLEILAWLVLLVPRTWIGRRLPLS